MAEHPSYLPTGGQATYCSSLNMCQTAIRHSDTCGHNPSSAPVKSHSSEYCCILGSCGTHPSMS